MKIRPIIFIAIFLATAAAYVLSSSIVSIQIMTLYLIFPVAAALIGLYTSKIYGFKSANGRAIILITTGLVFAAVAEIIWYVLKTFMNVDPYPSIADVFFLLAYPFFGAGIYQGYITSGIKLRQVKKPLLITVLLASIILTILVGYLDIYQAYDPSADIATSIVYIGYGIVDLVLVIGSLLTILVANEYKGGKLATFWKAIAAGFFFTLAGDILFSIFVDKTLADIKPYTYIELLWIAGYLFPAYALLENYIHVSEIQKKIRLKLLQRK